jgi:hypothetical protein
VDGLARSPAMPSRNTSPVTLLMLPKSRLCPAVAVKEDEPGPVGTLGRLHGRRGLRHPQHSKDDCARTLRLHQPVLMQSAELCTPGQRLGTTVRHAPRSPRCSCRPHMQAVPGAPFPPPPRCRTAHDSPPDAAQVEYEAGEGTYVKDSLVCASLVGERRVVPAEDGVRLTAPRRTAIGPGACTRPSPAQRHTVARAQPPPRSRPSPRLGCAEAAARGRARRQQRRADGAGGR